jgi:WD40 repeat protein
MISSLQFSPDDRWVLSSSLDGTVRAWKPKPRRANDPFFLWQFVRNIVFSPDGSQIVGVGSNHVAKLWSGTTQRPLATLGKEDVPIQDVAYSADGSLLAMLESDTSRVVLWNTASWQQERVLQSPPHPVDRIESVGPYLAGYGLGNRVYLWDMNDGRLTTEYLLGNSQDAPDALTFSSDGKRLAVSPAHSRGALRLHDVLTGKVLQNLQGCEATINALAFSPEGTRVAAGSTDTTALIWDVASGRLIHRLRGHTESVKAVVFSPSGRRLLTGGADDTIRTWNLDTAEELMSLPHPEGGDIELIRFSRDGYTIVTIDQFYINWYFQASPPKAELSEAR